MKNKKQNTKTNETKGFTLLELLVVVLIIGIFAGIGLPKYQLAVDKTEFRKLQSVAVSLRDAYNEHILIHGTGTRNFDDLSITLPSDFQSSYTSVRFNCVSNSSICCCLSKDSNDPTITVTSATLMCGKNDLSFIYSEAFLKADGTGVRQVGICLAAKDNKRANRLCGAIGQYESNNNNAWTPQGVVNGYTKYRLN